MDLRQFILYHKSNNSLETIVDGFEKSTFVESQSDISALVKLMISAFAADDSSKSKAYNQLQSGGIAGTKPNKTESSKKQSFCTEFNQMILNILGLLGFEFSKYLFFLFGIKHILIREIDIIANAKTYNDILTHMIYISNIFTLGDISSSLTGVDENTIQESPLDISDEFFINYCDESEFTHSINQHYTDIQVQNRKTKLFDKLINEVKSAVHRENILSFEDDKQNWVELLKLILQNLIINNYRINTVDDLVLNLGPYNVCYDKSFIKMFDILYDESFAQIPELGVKFKPHIKTIESELKLDVKTTKYLLSFNKYFHKIFDETLKSTIDIMDTSDILKVIVSDQMYERLSDLTLNLFVQISRKIATSQMTDIYFGKSTRIQFKQVYQAVLDCAPRNSIFTKTQRATIHLIALSRKVINESIKIVCNMKN